MPTTARPSRYPQVALTPTGTYQQPPSGIIISGYAYQDLFPARTANWLFRGYHDWLRGFDEQALRGTDGLDTAVVQRLSASPLDWALGSGLGPLAPTSGAVYIVGGERVDLSDAVSAYAAAGQTFAPSTTNYVHVRPQPALTGPLPSSTQGQILVSTNTSEAGYGRVLDVLTDGTDITNITETAGVVPGFKWSLAHTFDAATITSFSFDNAVGNGAAGFTTLTLFAGTATTTCLGVSGSTSVRMVEVVNGSTGSAIYGRNSSSGRGVEGSSAGSGSAVYGAATGSGKAGEFVGNASAPAVLATAGAGQIAVDGDGGAGANVAGVRGTAGGNTAIGVHGRSSLAAGTSQVGVYGEARGIGAIGVHGDASGGDGIGVIAQGKSTSPDYPAARIVPQSEDPAAYTSDGALIWRSGTGMKQLRHCVAGSSYRSLLSFGPGSALYIASVSNSVTSENAGVYTLAATLQARDSDGNGFYGASAGYYVLIEVEMDARANTAAAAIVDVKLTDETNASATIIERTAGTTALGAGYHLLHASTSWQRMVCLSTMYSPANDGDFTVGVNVRRGGAVGIHVRDIKIRIVGTFP